MRSYGVACALVAVLGALGCADPAPAERAATTSAASAAAPSHAPVTTETQSPASLTSTDASATPPDAREALLDGISDDMLRRGLLVVVPRSLTKPSPLLIFLHPEGMSGPRFTHDLGVELIARARGFAYAAPDGARVSWQASAAAWGAGAPDARQVEEIEAIVALAKRKPMIDPKRIYAVGWGSGGFMAHHLACSARGLRGVFSISGAGPAKADPPCEPAGPVDVVEIHGDKDRTVPYDGGVLALKPPLAPFPGARETFEAWGDRQGCGPAEPRDALEIFSDLEGAETGVAARPGCKGGARVELWTVRGGSHMLAIPNVLYPILKFIEQGAPR